MSENGKQAQQDIVVVGVDGSEGADAALEWAVAEARLRGARLRVVFAWTLSYPRGEGYGYLIGPIDVPPYGTVSDQRHAAERVLERATAHLWPTADGLEIDREVAEGPAAEVLVDAAADADLLVVGSRGHGGFVGLLLGSVSQQCAHRAACPVVIVRAAHDDPHPTRVEPAETGAAA